MDIHSVTGILKTFLRELPEALFSDLLYPRFFETFSAFSNNNEATRINELLKVYEELPQANKASINLILDHLIRLANLSLPLPCLACLIPLLSLSQGARKGGRQQDVAAQSGHGLWPDTVAAWTDAGEAEGSARCQHGGCDGTGWDTLLFSAGAHQEGLERDRRKERRVKEGQPSLYKNTTDIFYIYIYTKYDLCLKCLPAPHPLGEHTPAHTQTDRKKDTVG